MMHPPSPEQQAVLDQLLSFACESALTRQTRATPQISLGGFAGSGKTTVIRHLIDKLRADDTREWEVLVCALAGKACHVLTKKGVPAQTIHSLIYTAHYAEGRWWFEKNTDVAADLIIVDEASMVSRELFDDLTSYGIPIVWVGDHGQLEPIGDNPNLMHAPDLRLETIHRQALGNPVLHFAHHLRAGHPISAHRHDADERLRLISRASAGDWVHEVDQVITPYNKARHAINRLMRDERKAVLEPGEKIICLQNNEQYRLFNGLQAVIESVSVRGDTALVDLSADDGREITDVPLFVPQFGRNKFEKTFRSRTYWDYAYAITCHKAQGSEWPSVLVIEEPLMEDWIPSRWRYTAASRASERLIYAS